MRVIKFRGKTFDGKIIYGDLIQTDNDVRIRQWDGLEVEVDNATVAQLIGVGADGKEIYEGDTVKKITLDEKWSRKLKATFDLYREIRNGWIVLVKANIAN